MARDRAYNIGRWPILPIASESIDNLQPHRLWKNRARDFFAVKNPEQEQEPILVNSRHAGCFPVLMQGRVYMRTLIDLGSYRLPDVSLADENLHSWRWCCYDAFDRFGRFDPTILGSGMKLVMTDEDFEQAWNHEHKKNAEKNPFSKLPEEVRGRIFDEIAGVCTSSAREGQKASTNLQCASRYFYTAVGSWAYENRWLLFNEPGQLLDFLAHVNQAPKIDKSTFFGKITLQLHQQTERYFQSHYTFRDTSGNWIGSHYCQHLQGVYLTPKVTTNDWGFAVQELLKNHRVGTLILRPEPLLSYILNDRSLLVRSLFQFDAKARIDNLVVQGQTPGYIQLVAELQSALQRPTNFHGSKDTFTTNPATGETTTVQKPAAPPHTRKHKALELVGKDYDMGDHQEHMQRRRERLMHLKVLEEQEVKEKDEQRRERERKEEVMIGKMDTLDEGDEEVDLDDWEP